MSEHQFGGLDRDDEGWDFCRCDCGWISPPCPDAETAGGPPVTDPLSPTPEEGPTITARRAGVWVWQNWRWSDGLGFYATETPKDDEDGWWHWLCAKEAGHWWLTCDTPHFEPVECPTLSYASEIVEVANGGPQ